MIRKIYKNIFLKGFTLIELIVVIFIIATLTAAATVSYTKVQIYGRNAVRQSRLQIIATALEQYYNDHGFYPTTNVKSHYPADMQTAGKSVNDAIWCLLGGTYASSQPRRATYDALGNVTGYDWTCTQNINGGDIPAPYNVYLQSIPVDPSTAYPAQFAYASNGQGYALVTMCYEGTAPSDHLFLNNLYYDEAVYWTGGSLNTLSCGYPWINQYVINSPRGN